MNYEELAFANQQLAGMLKSGIPLEGGLKQLCATMRRGPLRAELQALEADLARGVPLVEALKARKLPVFYVHMLQVGVRANDLPGVLILVADYYSKANVLWTRLKGLMVYPLIVLAASTLLSFAAAHILQTLLADPNGFLASWGYWGDLPTGLSPGVVQARLFAPVVTLALLLGGLLVAISHPRSRARVRWLLPGAREASLAGVAGTLEVLLRGGVRLPDSLELVAEMERGSPVREELVGWKTRLAEGVSRPAGSTRPGTQLPAAFWWLIESAGEDLCGGFQRAAEFYAKRAEYRIDMMLYAALPVSVLFMGAVIVWQMVPVMDFFKFISQPL